MLVDLLMALVNMIAKYNEDQIVVRIDNFLISCKSILHYHIVVVVFKCLRLSSFTNTGHHDVQLVVEVAIINSSCCFGRNVFGHEQI